MADATTRIRVRPLARDCEADFWSLFSDERGTGWCYCAAWWVPTWEGWGERTAGENRALRAELLARGEHDGYLLYANDAPVGWCQVGPRDRLEKLRADLELAPDPEAWAITCLQIDPAMRRRGLARALVARVVDDLARRGVRRVEAYPRAEMPAEEGALWNGPRSVYEGAGFRPVAERPPRVVLRRDLSARPPAAR